MPEAPAGQPAHGQDFGVIDLAHEGVPMEKVRSANRRLLALAVLVIPTAFGGAIAFGIPSAAARSSSPAKAASVPQTVTATLISRPPGTLRPGTHVSHADLGPREFPNPHVGFSLASVGQAQYPAETVNGGQTWRTNGPALHLDAAQAPLAVVFTGASNAHTFYAFGGGQVVDATGDGGRHWWRASLGDAPIAVVPRLGGGLVAFTQDANSTGSGGVTVVYVSTDGGHHWHHSTRFGT